MLVEFFSWGGGYVCMFLVREWREGGGREGGKTGFESVGLHVGGWLGVSE